MEELDTNEAGCVIERSADANGDQVLVLSGELDISNADSFRQVVEEVVAEKLQRLVFDLTGLMFVDSSGIAVMVYCANNIQDVVLRHASPIVRRVVEATGLADILQLDPS
jgi:anti-anti-sigma factor